MIEPTRAQIKRQLAQLRLETERSRGLLDDMLEIRTNPPSPEALMTDDVIAVWRLAIDTAMDILVPALKKVVMLPAESAHGPHCRNGQNIDRIIGRVPLTRTEKAGWKE